MEIGSRDGLWDMVPTWKTLMFYWVTTIAHGMIMLESRV